MHTDKTLQEFINELDSRAIIVINAVNNCCSWSGRAKDVCNTFNAKTLLQIPLKWERNGFYTICYYV